MKRKREQRGTIIKKSGQWFLRVFESRVVDGKIMRVRAAKPLGPVTTRGKYPPAEIQQQAKQLADAINGSNTRPEMVLTVGDFVTGTYLPMVKREKRPSTSTYYRQTWNLHLSARCGQVWLKDVETYHVQQWLTDIAGSRTLGKRTLQHIKHLLSGIFSEAIRLGYLARANPVRDSRATGGAEIQETYAYSLDEIQSMLALFPEPVATIFAVAAFTGLRRGEIMGLLWENYQNGEIRVTRSIWKGIASDPKTRKSQGAVPVIRPLQQRLDLHRLRCGNPLSGPMFASDAGTPIRLDSMVRRVILPTLNRCEHCHKPEADHRRATHKYQRDSSLPQWRGWHACRRGLGSNLYALGVSDLVIQNILRHANVSTTMTYYVKSTPAASQEAMAKLESAVSLTDPKLTTSAAIGEKPEPVN